MSDKPKLVTLPLRVEPELFEWAKSEAANRGIKVTEWVKLLMFHAKEPPEEKPSFEFVTPGLYPPDDSGKWKLLEESVTAEQIIKEAKSEPIVNVPSLAKTTITCSVCGSGEPGGGRRWWSYGPSGALCMKCAGQ